LWFDRPEIPLKLPAENAKFSTDPYKNKTFQKKFISFIKIVNKPKYFICQFFGCICLRHTL
jgi:hypothetical protein